jgi:hypothetical protein
MPKPSKVKTDEHGVYVVRNGGIYRPQPSKNTYPAPKAVGAGYGPDRVNTTCVKAEDLIVATHINQTPFVRIRKEGEKEEWWHYHGPTENPAPFTPRL